VRPRIVLVAVCALLLLVFTRGAPIDGWDAAHAATAEAVFTNGSLAIDGTEFEHTPYRAVVAPDGETARTFATTPPLPSLLASVPYAIGGYWLATFVVAGLPFLALLFVLGAVLERAGTVNSGRTLVLCVVAFGTPLLGYATALDGLPLAALALATCVFALQRERAWLGGLAAGVAIACAPHDALGPVPATLVFALLLAPLAPRALVAFVLGAALPLGAHLAAQLGAGGTAFGWPGEAFAYPLAHRDLAALVARDPSASGPFDAWLGAHGVLARLPVVVLGAVGLVRALVDARPLAVRLALGALALALFGSLPDAQPFGLVRPAHLLLVVPLAFGASQLELRRVPSTTVLTAALAILSIPGAVLALRAPLFTWHLVPRTTPEVRLGGATPDLVAHWRAQWERAPLPRPAGRERMSGEFEARLEERAAFVLGDPRATDADRARLLAGLERIAKHLDDARSPLYTRPLVHYWIGRTLEARGEPARAEAAYRACVQLFPAFGAARQRIDALRRSADE